MATDKDKKANGEPEKEKEIGRGKNTNSAQEKFSEAIGNSAGETDAHCGARDRASESERATFSSAATNPKSHLRKAYGAPVDILVIERAGSRAGAIDDREVWL